MHTTSRIFGDEVNTLPTIPDVASIMEPEALTASEIFQAFAKADAAQKNTLRCATDLQEKNAKSLAKAKAAAAAGTFMSPGQDDGNARREDQNLDHDLEGESFMSTDSVSLASPDTHPTPLISDDTSSEPLSLSPFPAAAAAASRTGRTGVK